MKRIEKISEKKRLTERGRVTYSSLKDFYDAIINKEPRLTETLLTWEFDERYSLLTYQGNGYKVKIDLNKGQSFYVMMKGMFLSIEGRDIQYVYTDNDVVGVRTHDIFALELGNR